MDGAKARKNGRKTLSSCGTAPLKPKSGLKGPRIIKGRPCPGSLGVALAPRTKGGTPSMTRTKYIGLDVHHASIAVVPIFGSVMEDLRQRKYRRSELSLQQFKLLSATSALAVGAAIRHKADGQELERVGVPTCCTKEMTVGSLPSWSYTIPTKLHPANNWTYMLNRRGAL